MFGGEIAVLEKLEIIRTPFLNNLMETITIFGEDTLLIVMIAFLYFMVHKETAFRLCFLTVFSLGLNGILKNILKIPRPFSTGKITCVRPETATGYSFPSGHTQNFTTWTTAAARFFGKKRFLITTLLLSALMGFSRVYLGAHYPSDVIFGWLLGAGIGYFGSTLYEKQKNPRKWYLPVFLGMAVFGIYFLLFPDPHFADYLKCVGLMGGLTLSSCLDQRLGNLSDQVPFFKKLIRMILAILLALIVKKALGAINAPQNLSLGLLWDAFRYCILTVIVFGVYPLLLQKCKL